MDADFFCNLEVGAFILENVPIETFNIFESTQNKQQYGTKMTGT